MGRNRLRYNRQIIIVKGIIELFDVNKIDDPLTDESIKIIQDEIERKTGKSPAQLLIEREKRIHDAINLEVPDRVPVSLSFGCFPFKYCGLPLSTSYYNPSAYKKALIKTLLDFPTDSFFALGNISGFALELLGDTQFAWSGGPYPNDQETMFLEKEIMKEEEYDLLIADPGDYMLRYYLPRRYITLKPLATLPPLTSLLTAHGGISLAHGLNSPEILSAISTLAKADEEQEKFRSASDITRELLGIPRVSEFRSSGLHEPPFDQIVCLLRGLHGISLDMFKRPEKLISAMNKLLEWGLLTSKSASPEDFGKLMVNGGGNHFSSEEFLSRKQFDTFVWPTWKKALIGLVERGFIPQCTMEGKNDDRIEPFLEIPKGKGVISFEKVDMSRAKSILNGHLCISGNVPVSLMWGGTPREVEEYCKTLINTCGKDGGFILSAGAGLDDAKPENIHAMINAAEKYGRNY